MPDADEKRSVPRLSAVIITRDEARNIVPCLESLSFCDERIVVDDGSVDDTVRLAEAAGARVVFHPFEGFGAQKGFALSQATGEWVLSLDADERITPVLAVEIRRAIETGSANGYDIPRQSTFCGRPMRHSGWFPDYVLRLFRRDKAHFSSDIVHERVICEAPIGRLSAPIVHHPVLRLEDSLSRMDRYSTAGAERIAASGRRVWFVTGIVRGYWTFVRTYVLQLGFLDGHEGFLLAVANAEGTYYRYMKAWMMGRRRG